MGRTRSTAQNDHRQGADDRPRDRWPADPAGASGRRGPDLVHLGPLRAGRLAHRRRRHRERGGGDRADPDAEPDPRRGRSGGAAGRRADAGRRGCDLHRQRRLALRAVTVDSFDPTTGRPCRRDRGVRSSWCPAAVGSRPSTPRSTIWARCPRSGAPGRPDPGRDQHRFAGAHHVAAQQHRPQARPHRPGAAGGRDRLGVGRRRAGAARRPGHHADRRRGRRQRRQRGAGHRAQLRPAGHRHLGLGQQVVRSRRWSGRPGPQVDDVATAATGRRGAGELLDRGGDQRSHRHRDADRHLHPRRQRPDRDRPGRRSSAPAAACTSRRPPAA